MIDLIRKRARLLSHLRRFFDSREFCEVQPPTLGRDCVIDAYLDPISLAAAELGVPDGDGFATEYFLQTSPESSMKRVLAKASEGRQVPPSIYSIGPVYRSSEVGPLHNIEFTMLEWYEVGGNAKTAIELLGTLATETWTETESGVADYEVASYRSLFQTALGFDPIDITIDELRLAATNVIPGLEKPNSIDRNNLLEILFDGVIQPSLGIESPMIVRDYPLSQAALAKQSETDPQCAERFELFIRGVEIANGYDELTDAEVFRDRAIRANQTRRQRGSRELVTESTLYRAMQRGLPPCAGVAVGVDRLQMACTGAASLDEVMPLTIKEA